MSEYQKPDWAKKAEEEQERRRLEEVRKHKEYQDSLKGRKGYFNPSGDGCKYPHSR